MKLNEVMKRVEKVNELRDILNINKAYVEIYIDDDQLGKEFYTLNELVLEIKREYIADFWRELLKVDFTKTYHNTLSAYVQTTDEFGNTFSQKVDLFIDC